MIKDDIKKDFFYNNANDYNNINTWKAVETNLVIPECFCLFSS